ncbi:hypothetical protein NDU88_004906 [Pleurodeles waltl]|uniref:Uncharacterized protein n=1 Tax=Pleurodeles waltl TaxID=8319 RepID=A0AAV7VK41_PLEWA|nr:hypothetical protein NDU88_004906 [Pleurodeles waltl]
MLRQSTLVSRRDTIERRYRLCDYIIKEHTTHLKSNISEDLAAKTRSLLNSTTGNGPEEGDLLYNITKHRNARRPFGPYGTTQIEPR